MIDQLEKDRAVRPDLFDFFGAIKPEKLNEWLRERRLIVPSDLRDFWRESGGGDLFESETVLGPFGPADLDDDVDGMSRYQWQKGMTPDWLVFHKGLGLSVVIMSSGKYANAREESFAVQQTFESLENWYIHFIRKEYAQRYGLP